MLSYVAMLRFILQLSRLLSQSITIPPVVITHPLGKIIENIFTVLFSQPSQILGLSGGVNRFCNKSCIYSQLKRVTYGRTHRQAAMRTQYSATFTIRRPYADKKSLIAHFVLHHYISGISFMLHFFSIILISLLHIHLMSLKQFVLFIITSTVQCP